VATFAAVFLMTLAGQSAAPAQIPAIPGHAASTAPAQPDVIVECLDESLASEAEPWRTEVARRFHNSVEIFCHGNSQIAGQWVIVPRSQPILVGDFLAVERVKYPGRTLVLLACNEKHYVLHGFPNTYYSPSSVWVVPDRAVIADETVKYSLTVDSVHPDPFPGLPPGLLPFVFPAAPSVGERHSRSFYDPDCVGDIWEFVAAD
jgi:hypothetical protein